MADGTAAIVWGIPVGIVQLLDSLDAYRGALPTIHNLRLCHQFGKGENAHITKLPKEIIDLIERKLLDKHLEKDLWDQGWQKAYCCFEGSCHPSSHYMDSAYEQLHEDAMDAVCEEHPEFDLEEMMDSDKGYSTEFEELVEDKMDDMAFDYDGHWDMVFDSKFSWQSRFSAPKDAKIMKYRELLRTHFGLECFTMHDNLDDISSGYLVRNDKRFRRKPPPEKATLCFLAMPTQRSKWRANIDADMDMPYGVSGKSMLIALESLRLTEDHRKRFAKALLNLNLKPSVHPSQLHGTLSAFSPQNGYADLQDKIAPKKTGQLSVEEMAQRDAEIAKRIETLEQSQWPKLMLLVKEHIDGGF